MGVLDGLLEKITDKKDWLEQLGIYKAILERIG
jgi:hypothetical protein